MKKLLVFLLLLNLTGCARGHMSEMYAPDTSYQSGYIDGESVYDSDTFDEQKIAYFPESETEGLVLELDQEKIIKTGALSLHMQDVREGMEAIKVKVEELGGDVLSSTLNRYDNAYYAYVTVRIPSDQFDASVTALKEMALYTISENISADDVTEAYMDLETRLSNLQAEEQQYLEILNKAQTVEEILQVTDYLSDVRYEIESIQSQLQYYDNNVNYSIISLTLTEDESLEAVKETWRPISTIREALSDWFIFLQDLVDFGIYALIFAWPILLLLILFFIFKRGRSAKRHK